MTETPVAPQTSVWIAVRKDGSTYHDGEATYAQLRADGNLDALILQWGATQLVVKIPEGAKPFFLRRWRPLISLETGEEVRPTLEFASAVGWEKVGGAADGEHSVAWLAHDGSIVFSDQTDFDNLMP